MKKLRVKAFISGLLFVFCCSLIARAQDPAATPAATDAQTDDQKQKEKEALEKKATALLEQVVGEAQTLHLPEKTIT